MGARLAIRAAAACQVEKSLPASARLALVIMATRALDSKGRNPEDPVGLYWQGHVSLGLDVFGIWITDKSRERAITRILRDLENRNLIALYDENRGGRRVWQVLPGPR